MCMSLIQVHVWSKRVRHSGTLLASENVLGILLDKPLSESVPTRDLNEYARDDMHK
jgi:hypothetical protein